MDAEKRKALEAAGFEITTVQEFLGLSDAEMQLAVARARMASEIQRRRKARKLTQPGLAKLLNTKQPRISLIEAADAGVSIDQMMTAMLATGATMEEVGDTIGGRSIAKPRIRRAESVARVSE